MQKPSRETHTTALQMCGIGAVSGTLRNWPLLNSALQEQGYSLHLDTPCNVIVPLVRWLVGSLQNSGMW